MRRERGISKLTQQEIIEMGINSKVLINARPGIGKTYTLIQRICYLIGDLESDGDYNFDHFNSLLPREILVLCFANTTVETIKERVGEYSRDVREILITTFDSFTGKILYESGTISMTATSYEDNIRHLIKLLENKKEAVLDYIEEFKYLFVDEAQDLVGDRSRLVDLILEQMDGGMLFQDPNQAIYNFGAQKTGSVDFSKIMDVYTLEGKNFRLGKNLQVLENNLRELLESKEEDYLKYLEVMKSYDLSNYRGDEEFNVILCKNRYIMNKEYYERIQKKMKVRIFEPKSDTLYPRWLGQIFYDFQDNEITIEELGRRMRIVTDQINVKSEWNTLKQIEKQGANKRREPLSKLKKNKIVIDYLLTGLLNKKWLSVLSNVPDEDSTIISTIHRAKGKEFKKVLLSLPALSKSEDTPNVIYVGATRASDDFASTTISHQVPMYLEKEKKWLWIYNHKFFLTFGLKEDHDDQGVFVSVSDKNAFLRNQKIINNLTINDELTLFLNFKLNGWFIQFQEGGEYVNLQKMSNKFKNDLRSISFKIIKRRRWISHINSVRLERIGTAILHPDSKERKYCPSGIYNILRIVGYNSPLNIR